MIICHCLGLTDRAVRQAIRQGAHTPAALASTCGASAGCGGCRPTVAEILADELRVVPDERLPQLRQSA